MSEWKETEIGLIPQEWNLSQLENCVDQQRGITYGIVKVGEFIPKGIPVVRGGDIKEGKIVFDESKRVTEEISNQFKRTILKGGEILLNLIAEPGHAAIVPDSLIGCNVSRDVAVIPLDKSVARNFVCYFLRSKAGIDWLTRRLQGTVTKKINLGVLKEFPIPIFAIEKQKAIADVLSCLDGKVENLRRQNETLEAIAQTLFKHWFMDFEFPNEDGKPYKSSGGAMIPSELGEIPEGWRVGTLGDEFDISIGKTPPRKEKEWFSLNSQDIRWISIKDMRESGVFINQTSEFLTRTSIDKFNIRIIPDNTVILSFKLTVGRVAITMGEMTSNEAIAHIKNKLSYISSEYIYLFFKRFNFDKLGSTSSIATAVNSKTIKSIKLILPTKTIIDSFSESVKPIFNKVRNNQKQIQTLTKTRDTLLPKLMSGQLRVKEQKL